jgi:D-alanyl-D-alanine carboxypeptidase
MSVVSTSALPGLAFAAAVALSACEPGPDRQLLESTLDAAREAAGAPGAIFGVRLPDGETELVASGISDLEADRRIRKSDPYFHGPITKRFTATLIMQMVDDGALDLAATVSDFLPDFPRGHEITIRHLLQQTSGLKDFYLYFYIRPERDEMIDLVTREWTQDELIAYAGRFGHWFDPGTGWDYSSTNYFLLGVLAERATDRSLASLLRDRVFDPASATSTWLHEYEATRGQRSTGYLGFVEGWPHSEMFGDLASTRELESSNAEWAAGGAVGTASDALSTMASLMEGRSTSSQSLSDMTDFVDAASLGAESAVPDLESRYGLGLMRIVRSGYELIGHGGIFLGHTAGLWHLPDCGVTVSLYLNRGFAPQRDVLDAMIPALAAADARAAGCFGA